ncbi:MAG: glycoside hydrolase family 3 C-terminal domain-containing protein [Clostridia bacterium]|nr:glycoside hydrolase family 3 C-terminal domain-containing protein [Clostridia bacterium]
MKKSNLYRGLTSAAAFVECLVLGFSIAAFDNSAVVNNALDLSTSKLVLKDGITSEDEVEKPQYFKSKFAADINNPTEAEIAKKNEAVAAFVETEEEEGAVLLTNKNHALPLAKGMSVTLFGQATVNPYTKGSSGGGSGGTKVTYLDALQDETRAGFRINQTLVDAYSSSRIKRNASNRVIGEAPKSLYTDEIKATFKDYSDAAIVILAREGAESNDLYTNDSEGISQLALHKDEKDMLELVREYKENGTFKKVIVLINSGHPMEVKWLDEYKVDACMVIGGPGNSTGFRGVSDLLVGNANPSGRLVDTYASNSLSAPATQNFGEYAYTNKSEVAKGVKDNVAECQYYVVQTEGIYVGYKYYETRYEDCVLNQGNANGNAGVFDSKGGWSYAEEVSFPFGYGISYTTFEQTMGEVVDNKDGTMTVKGTVKNTGDVAGKSVVELYAQTPYGDYEKTNKVEKSAVQLVGFTKTKEIPAGQTVDFEITFDKYFLASYDYTNAKGYIMSAGDYYLAIGNDAHDALNNILVKKGANVSGDGAKAYTWNQKSLDTETYRKSSTGVEVTNRLDEADINYWVKGAATYVTRNDWQGTFPTSATTVTASKELIDKLDDGNYEKPANAPSAMSVKLGVDQGIKLADMYGVPYEDALWDQFIDQLSLSDLILATMDSSGIAEIPTIASPKTSNGDGPDGIAGNAYVNESVAAASWSKEMLAMRGYYMGEDAVLAHRAQQAWCPGVDTHRTPFGGRNFEYFSEDAILAYELSAATCAAMEEMGVSAGPKHFFANDQETWRTGVATYGNEQGFREIQLRAFEGCFVKGGATSVMTAFNRIGPIWVGHYSDVQDGILRGEWGFVGMVITDAAGVNSYMHSVDCLMNGTDMFCFTRGSAAEKRTKEIMNQIQTTDDGNIIVQLKEVSHRIFYTYAHTNLMNGLSSAYTVVSVTPWWQPTVIAINAVLCAGIVALGALFAVNAYKKEEN